MSRWDNGSCGACGYNPCRCTARAEALASIIDDPHRSRPPKAESPLDWYRRVIDPTTPRFAYEDAVDGMYAMLSGAMEGVLRALVYDHGVHWRQLSIVHSVSEPELRRVIVLEEGKIYMAGHVRGYFGGRNGFRFLLDARAYSRKEWRA